MPMKIAYFVTPHGFGHAARAAAVMAALRRTGPNSEFEIFTTVPSWFFQDSLGDQFQYVEFTSDVGLVQDSPFAENIPATIQRLLNNQQNQDKLSTWAAGQLDSREISLVVCDISPVGVLAAKNAGVPAVLIENFTWDFIYNGYKKKYSGLTEYIQPLREIYRQSDFHIQAVPICVEQKSATKVAPISRKPTLARNAVREQLGIPTDSRVILVTMGGIESRYAALANLKKYRGVVFVIPGGSERFMKEDNLILLPHRSHFYHPDLVAASDAVIGKLGYSTLAEAYQAGLPYAYIPRPAFPETPSMADFARRQMGAIEMPVTEFLSGAWNTVPDQLLSLPRAKREEQNGADQAADAIRSRYG